MSLIPGWDSQKTTAFAPDMASVKAAKKLALPHKWATLGRDDYTAWGLFQGSGKEPYQVRLDLLRLQTGEPAHHCSCPSRKQPCKHAVALLFLMVEQPQAVAPAAAPAWVAEWLDKQAQRAHKEETRKKKRQDKRSDPAEVVRRLENRQQQIAAGLAELEQWLLDLLRGGLAESHLHGYTFWQGMAARMVDAGAPGLAGWLENMAGLTSRQGATGRGQQAAVSLLLTELGRLYLAVHGFKQFDSLPPAIQADLRTLVGWHVRREELSGGPAVRDRWLVLGRREQLADRRLRQQRLWLWGAQSRRFALLLEFAFGDATFDTLLLPGETIEAGLVFFPGQIPLRAFIQDRATPPLARDSFPLPTGHTILQALEQYAAALAQNPWLHHFPFLLGRVWPHTYSGGWVVREEDGTALPLSPAFPHRWPLLALSGGHPLRLMGEWDGRHLLPIAALVDEGSGQPGRFVDFDLVETV